MVDDENTMDYIEVRQSEENQPKRSTTLERADKILIGFTLVVVSVTACYVLQVSSTIQKEMVMHRQYWLHRRMAGNCWIHANRRMQASSQVFSMEKQYYTSFLTQLGSMQQKLDQKSFDSKQILDSLALTTEQQAKSVINGDQSPEMHSATGLIDSSSFKNPDSMDLTILAGITQQRVDFAKALRKLRDQPLDQMSPLALEEQAYYESTYHIGIYEELPFCIVVPTYNNEQGNRYKSNLDSILQQNYTNYHIAIIEDASTDNTGKLLDQHIAEIKQKYPHKKFRIQIHHNDQQQRALPNIRKAAFSYCQPNEIFLIVDGDDQILGRQVLKLFNSVFQKEKSWFVYTNFISFVGTVGYSRSYKKQVKEKNTYRKAGFVSSHLRAFYTQLVRLIRDEDLKDEEGEYFRAANDVAICLPVLEMSHTRVTYVPEITYLYNSDTGENNHRVRLNQQTTNARNIRKKVAYEPLQTLFDDI